CTHTLARALERACDVCRVCVCMCVCVCFCFICVVGRYVCVCVHWCICVCVCVCVCVCECECVHSTVICVSAFVLTQHSCCCPFNNQECCVRTKADTHITVECTHSHSHTQVCI